MIRSQRRVSVRGMILATLIFAHALILKTAGTVNEKWYWTLLVSVPFLLIAISNPQPGKHKRIK